MNNKKKIILIIAVLFLIAAGCSLAALFAPLGKFRGMVVKISVLAFLATLVFIAGLIKGR